MPGHDCLHFPSLLGATLEPTAHQWPLHAGHRICLLYAVLLGVNHLLAAWTSEKALLGPFTENRAVQVAA